MSYIGNCLVINSGCNVAKLSDFYRIVVKFNFQVFRVVFNKDLRLSLSKN